MFSRVLFILFLIVFVYCAFSVLYILVFAVASLKNSRKIFPENYLFLKKIAILIPAYKEDNIIISTVKNILSQNYPAELFDVYVIADGFKQSTVEELKTLPIKVVEVSFKNSSKTKSLNECFKAISLDYDVALICDADNMLGKGFLKSINDAFLNGFKAVQGRRVAKNMDSSFAILDSCSEAINNNIFRKGANALGLSSSVIGSGMAFGFNILRNALANISAISGFDKPLQLKIVEDGTKIQYLENALIFDEKIDNSAAFEQQRKRWLMSQFIYLKAYFGKGIRQLFKGNFSYFNLAVLNNIVPPRAFLMAGLPLLSIAAIFISNGWLLVCFLLIFLYALSLVLATPAELKNKQLVNALLHLPKAIGLMVGNIFRMKKAKHVFIHTTHTKNEVTNPLFTLNGD